MLDIVTLDKKVVVFGTGRRADIIVRTHNLRPEYYVDNDPSKWNKTHNNRLINKPDYLLKEDKNTLIIIVASMYYNQIAKQLIQMGFEENYQFYDGTLFTDKCYFNESYSQFGEDMVLRSIFEGEKKKKGFYVDIGAYHPKRFSNTYYFYKNGWRGINIDAKPGSMELFNKFRPEDINVEIGISENGGDLTYYMFDEPALNSFNKDISLHYENKGEKVISKIRIPTDTLENILDKYLKDEEITFMSIDVEGFEMQVLRSNNWEKYRPEYLLIEDAFSSLKNFINNNIYHYLEENKYELIYKVGITWIFKNFLKYE